MPPCTEPEKCNLPGDLRAHIDREELRMKEGDERMGRIEKDLAEVASDLKPLTKLYYMVVGASTVGLMLMSVLLYIYQDDKASRAEERGQMKVIVAEVQKQGTTLEKLIQAHQELEKDTVKEFDRLQKALEKR